MESHQTHYIEAGTLHMYTVLFCTFVGSNVRLYIGTPENVCIFVLL